MNPGELTNPQTDSVKPAGEDTPTPWRLLLIIAGVGVALRLLVTWAIWANGGSSLNGDEGSYLLSAIAVSQGQDVPDLLVWLRAPGYIFFAGLVLAATGGQILAVNLVQVALAAPLTVLFYFLGKATTSDPDLGRRVGLWSAALIACNPIFIFYNNLFISEPLFIFLLAVLLVALLGYRRALVSGSRYSYLWLVAAGLIAGYCWLTRSSMLAYLPWVVLWLVYLHRRALWKAIVPILIFITFVAVVVLPWSFHNLERYGAFILVDTTGPINFYFDNYSPSSVETRLDLRTIEGHAARQEYALRSTLGWISEHKREFIRNVTSRLAAGWLPDPFTEMRLPVREKLPGTAAWVRDLYALTGSLAYITLIILIVVGLIYAPRSDIKVLVVLLAVSFVVSVVITHNDPRYRLPSLAFLSVFAGYALATRGIFWPLTRVGKPVVQAVASAGFAVLFILLSLPPLLPGLFRSIEARSLELSSLFKGSLPDRALTLEQVAQLDEVYSAPWREAAAAWASAGDTGKAFDDYFEAWFHEPNDWRATAMLSKLYRDQGEAQQSRKTADAIAPTFNAIMQRWAWEQFDPPDREVDVGGADIGWLKGFHATEVQETDGQFVTYRWSTGSADIKVRQHTDDRTVLLVARALPGPGGEPLSVQWRINGVDAGAQVMGGQWQTYRFQLSDEMLRDDTVVLELEARARRPSIEDWRELAVAVDKVSTGP